MRAAEVIGDVRGRIARLPASFAARLREAPLSTLALVAAGLLFAFVVVHQLLSASLPLIVFEGHHWRQAFTYGVAWNYAHGTIDVLRPRMFVELARSNVVPMEAPLYPLLASVLLRVTGDSVVGPRVLSWLGLAATVWVLWSWLSDPRCPSGGLADRAGVLVALALAPMVGVDFRAIQPEPLAAGSAIVSALFFARYATTDRRADLLAGAVLFGLSLLAKPLALGVAPSLVLFAAWGKGRWLGRGLLAGAALVVALLPWLAWDRWAQHVLATELHGEWIIEIGHPPAAMLRTLLAGQHSGIALLHHLPNYASSWWLAPAIAAGLHRGLVERRWRRLSIPLLAWIVGYMIELLSVGERLSSNAYYFILAAAPLAFFAALGLGALVRMLDASQQQVSRAVFRAGLACLILLPLGTAFSRPSAWSNIADVAALGFDRNRGVWASDLGLGRLLFSLLVLFALAPHVRPRRTPRWLGAPLALAIAALVVRPACDARQYFRFYVAEHWRAGFADELRELRAAVDRHSRRDDRVIVSPGGTYREPLMVYYYYALRDGFPYRDGATSADLDRMRAAGARLYLRVDHAGKVKHGDIPGRLLATGAWWRLSCVAADGCAPLAR